MNNRVPDIEWKQFNSRVLHIWNEYVKSEDVWLFTSPSEEEEYNLIFISLFIVILFQIIEFCLLFPLHFSMN
jgi:hypothetical protein